MIKHSVVLVPFPFDDLSGAKPRPALCLTNEIGKLKHVVIAFISSNLGQKLLDSDIILEKGSDFWQGTGLQVDSLVRLHKLVTIPKSLMKRKLGMINETLRDEVYEKLMLMFKN
jgi:mRNA interferase MazF